jgi:hypothetical protein
MLGSTATLILPQRSAHAGIGGFLIREGGAAG